MAARIYLPRSVRWQEGEIHFLLDPEAPHWIAVDARGEQICRWAEEGLTVSEMTAGYARAFGCDTAKGWLHVTDFASALLRSGFASAEPAVRAPYRGRAAYARPAALRELWFHTNNICNLACSHCLVSSAPWVKDWGLPTAEVKRLVDEAAELGVERFYFTGGEPFMRKDLLELAGHVTQSRGRELIVLTNATLLKGERARQLSSLSRERVRFQVSVDGASPETNDPIRGKGSFQAACEGLRLLASLGFPTSLTTVVTARNLEELPELTRLAHRLGVGTQHLMWPHRRGRILEEGAALGLPAPDRILEAFRRLKPLADELGVRIDNYESIKQRVNGRPGVKYDLGNACWDSLCIYSDGVVYPSAALADVKNLALGSVAGASGSATTRLGSQGLSLRRIWEESPVAEEFRRASVIQKSDLADDPFRFLTGGGDLEHSYSSSGELTGPDPYYPVYTGMMRDAMGELARARWQAVNRRSGYDAPRVLHGMGEGAIHCATEDLAVTGEVDVRTLHSNCVLAFDVDKPRRLVREFYGKAAQTPQPQLCCPTQPDAALLSHIPKEVVDRFYGCGSPVTLGELRAGETMADLGSGAGIDCFIAAKLVGPQGKVIGVDMTEEMLRVARGNQPVVAANLGYDVVEFRQGYLEQVPVESKSVDLATSNCVINLSPDKPKVFAEIWRILKDHGRVVIADIVSDRLVPAHLKVNPQLWGECTVGALTEEEFLARLQEAGFYGLSVLRKAYWRGIEGYDFYSVTVRGFKFEKSAGCRFIGQRAVYRGPWKATVDEEGHLFPRDVEVEVCTDTAAKLSNPPYAGSFLVIASPPSDSLGAGSGAKQSGLEIASSPAAPRNDDTCGSGCC